MSDRKKYRLRYTIYDVTFKDYPKEISVITHEPSAYIERIKSDIQMNSPNLMVGSYVIEPINHLKLVK
jgi:hypothetical protein